MPFGFIFAAVVFAVVCLWPGGPTLAPGAGAGRAASLLWAMLGASLSLGLLLRQPWARFAGIAAAAFLAALGARQILLSGGVADHLVFFAALATLVLLAIPVTGDARRGLPPQAPRRRLLAGSLGITTAGSLLCLVGIVFWSFLSTQEVPAGRPSRSAAAPRTLGARGAEARVRWNAFGPALERAGADGKPVLLQFYASWCGACKLMNRTTFRHPEVVERLGDVIPVRVDAEDAVREMGPSGVELAEKYEIQGYPTHIVLDPAGRELSRRTGYLEPAVFLTWLERVMQRPRSTRG